MVAAAEAAVNAELAAVKVSGGGGGDGDDEDGPRVGGLEACLHGLDELRGFVRAGGLLAARGLPLPVQRINGVGAEEAAKCVRQLLGRVQRWGCRARRGEVVLISRAGTGLGRLLGSGLGWRGRM